MTIIIKINSFGQPTELDEIIIHFNKLYLELKKANPNVEMNVKVS